MKVGRRADLQDPGWSLVALRPPGGRLEGRAVDHCAAVLQL